jgi:hypothetical protein
MLFTSVLCVTWAASRKDAAARSCSCPAVAILLSYVAVAALRTCSWALVRGADSMVVCVAGGCSHGGRSFGEEEQ